MRHADPISIVDDLNVDAIRARLSDLDDQAAALRVLLRAAMARDRRRKREQPTQKREVPNE